MEPSPFPHVTGLTRSIVLFRAMARNVVTWEELTIWAGDDGRNVSMPFR